MKIKIIVATHKPCWIPSAEYYLPLHVGREGKPDIGFVGDNTGDNISKKNASYCELTGMYWAWKNLRSVDIIGLCHYRRYFDLTSAKSIDNEPYIKKSIPIASNEIIEKILDKHDIIIGGYSYLYESVWDNYAIGHSLSDIKVVEQVIGQITPEYRGAFNHVMKECNHYAGCNMLICKKKLFDDYCNWLFTILDAVEKKIDTSNYDSYQKRIFGFISERLMNVYIYHHSLSVCHRPMIALMNGTTPSRFKQLIHKMKANLCFYMKKS